MSIPKLASDSGMGGHTLPSLWQRCSCLCPHRQLSFEPLHDLVLVDHRLLESVVAATIESYASFWVLNVSAQFPRQSNLWMAEEIRFFGRLSAYALAVGAGYWFISYEIAGTVLLLGFGIATGVAFIVLRQGRPASGDPGEDEVASYPGRPDGPFGDESAPVPTRSAAPLMVGFGIAVMALAGAFGPWFLLTGAIPFLIGAVDWLRAAGRELRQRDRADARRPGRRRGTDRPRMKHADHVALIRGGVERRGTRWLELGAGDGAFTLALADLLGPGGSILAVDSDRWALAELAARLASRAPELALDDAGRRLRDRAAQQARSMACSPPTACISSPTRRRSLRAVQRRSCRAARSCSSSTTPSTATRTSRTHRLVPPAVAGHGRRLHSSRVSCTAFQAGSWARSTAPWRAGRGQRNRPALATRRPGLDASGTLRHSRRRPRGVGPERPWSERGTVRAARARRMRRSLASRAGGAR